MAGHPHIWLRMRSLQPAVWSPCSHCRTNASLFVAHRRPFSSSLQAEAGSSSRYIARQKKDPVSIPSPLSRAVRTSILISCQVPVTFPCCQYVKLRKQGQSPVSSDNASHAGAIYASRAAFKLAQLDDIHKFLPHDAGNQHPRVIVDLGAAPGGWTQVAVERTSKGLGSSKSSSRRTQIYALDILPMSPVEGATFIQGDFLDPATQLKLEEAILANAGAEPAGPTNPAVDQGLRPSPASPTSVGLVDVVLSDMMAPTTGNVISDTEASLDLCRSAFMFALRNLRQSGKSPDHQFFVCKFFASPAADHFRKRVLEPAFHRVKTEKGRIDASRKESKEAFWVCQGFRGHQSVDLDAIYSEP